MCKLLLFLQSGFPKCALSYPNYANYGMFLALGDQKLLTISETGIYTF